MSDYKLVPVEPTPKMVEAAADAYMPFGDMDLALRMAILAAPAVQGEPVYLYRRLGLHDFVTCDFTRYTELSGKPNFFETKILYTAPQPPFQLPDFATDPDDSDEVASLWDHGYKRGWNACLEAATKAMQPAEQQPDVAQLVEALVACAKASSAAEVGLIVDDALAAHRKQGGEV